MSQIFVSTAKRFMPSSFSERSVLTDNSEQEKDGAFSDDFDAMFEPNSKLSPKPRRDSSSDIFPRTDSNSSYNDESTRDYVSSGTAPISTVTSLKSSNINEQIFGTVSDDIADYFEEGEVRHILVCVFLRNSFWFIITML